VTVVVGAVSDLGRVRTNNEDNYVVLVAPDLPAGLDAVLVVADGMGGAQAGEVASGLVVERFTGSFGPDAGPQRIEAGLDLGPVLVRIIQEANDDVFNAALRDPRLHGMGTTVVAAAIAGDRLYLGYVGDSRAYLIDDANIYQLNRDHSWVAEEVRAGRLTKAEAQHHPRRNVLTRAVGVVSGVEVETQTFDLGAGDHLLMCTDGLTNLVSESELLQVLRDGDDPIRAAQKLIQTANDRGSPDNVTVVIARYLDRVKAPDRSRETETLPGLPAPRGR